MVEEQLNEQMARAVGGDELACAALYYAFSPAVLRLALGLLNDLADAEDDLDEPTVEPSRFQSSAGRFPGGWVAFPIGWQSIPEERWLARETRLAIEGAIAALPPNQREVVTLRDVEGWSSDEVCNVLGIAETNQRVLLHRGRAKVRRALEQYLNLDREGRAA